MLKILCHQGSNIIEDEEISSIFKTWCRGTKNRIYLCAYIDGIADLWIRFANLTMCIQS